MKLYTIKQIASRVGRAPSNVSSQVFKMGFVPIETEKINSNCTRNWYSFEDSNKVLNFYENLDEPEIVVTNKQKNILFPKVIYHETIFYIRESKINHQ